MKGRLHRVPYFYVHLVVPGKQPHSSCLPLAHCFIKVSGYLLIVFLKAHTARVLQARLEALHSSLSFKFAAIELWLGNGFIFYFLKSILYSCVLKANTRILIPNSAEKMGEKGRRGIPRQLGAGVFNASFISVCTRENGVGVLLRHTAYICLTDK